MNTRQLGLEETRFNSCPFQDFLETDDTHCLSFQDSKQQYEVLSENHPKLPQWLADINHVGFGDISAKPIPTYDFPLFIPIVKSGSHKIMGGVSPPFVAVMIGHILDSSYNPIEIDVRTRFGISPDSKIILQCYGKDELIERVWTKKKEIIPKIAAMGFDLITGVNYSVWLNQPHAERLINLKRSLITFEDFQNCGAPAIPHLYWYGKRDLDRWKIWIRENPNIKYIAINLQTERVNKIWEQTIDDLRCFSLELDRPIHFLITGPSTVTRISQLQSVFAKYSILNARCARSAACGHLMSQEGERLISRYSSSPRNEIMQQNIAFYQGAMKVHYSFPFSSHK